MTGIFLNTGEPRSVLRHQLPSFTGKVVPALFSTILNDQLCADILFGGLDFSPGRPVRHAQVLSGLLEGAVGFNPLKKLGPPGAKEYAVVCFEPEVQANGGMFLGHDRFRL